MTFSLLARSLAALVPAVALVACSQPDSSPADGGDAGNLSRDGSVPAAGQGPSLADGQSAPIMLDVVLPQDLAAEPLAGELGCAFSFSRGDDPLLVAKGFVDSQSQATGAVKVDGTVMRLAKEGEGGFADMPSGASFTNGMVSAKVEVTGDADAGAAASESPLKTARLTIARGTRQIVIDGFYACAP